MKIASNKYHIKSFKIIVKGRRKKFKLLNSNKVKNGTGQCTQRNTIYVWLWNIKRQIQFFEFWHTYHNTWILLHNCDFGDR